MDKLTITIGIGRNVADQPMSDDSWLLFKSDVRTLLVREGAEVYFAGDGDATDELGHLEQSHTIVASVDVPHLLRIRDDLGTLATKWDQRCIALTWGKTELVDAS